LVAQKQITAVSFVRGERGSAVEPAYDTLVIKYDPDEMRMAVVEDRMS
jgi:hypothetical protein